MSGYIIFFSSNALREVDRSLQIEKSLIKHKFLINMVHADFKKKK